ncbi:MAG: hypothetical protein ACI4EG_06190 [Fusicatenibacter sp.]
MKQKILSFFLVLTLIGGIAGMPVHALERKTTTIENTAVYSEDPALSDMEATEGADTTESTEGTQSEQSSEPTTELTPSEPLKPSGLTAPTPLPVTSQIPAGLGNNTEHISSSMDMAYEDGTWEEFRKETQFGTEVSRPIAELPQNQDTEEVTERASLAWWFAILILGGVAIAAFVGGTIIRYQTKKNGRYL